MKYIACIIIQFACIYALLKLCRWTGNIEVYEIGGVRGGLGEF